MGTGVALIGGSIFTGLSAQGLYQDLATRRDNQQLIASKDIEVGNQWVLITNILMGLGVTSLSTGGVLWMLSPDETNQQMPPNGFSTTPQLWQKSPTTRSSFSDSRLKE